MSRPKDDPPKAADTLDAPRPPRVEPSQTVIVDEDAVVDPASQKTAAMPAWPADGAPLATQPTPAWTEPAPHPSGVVTEPTPAWEQSDTTRPRPALKVSELPTRAQLAPVAPSEDEVRRAVTRPSEAVKRRQLPRAVKLALAGVGSLALVSMLWLFGRADVVQDPSRPVPLSKLPLAIPKEAPPPPEKRVDVTPVIAAPKEPPRPPLSMELTLDAGAGLPPETKTVPASIVRIETEPTATISWNGEDFGWQPALITMPVGQNFITVENKELGLKKTLSITAADTERTFLRFEFAKGWLSVDRPGNAKVSVEGVKVTQRAVLVWEGRHRVDCVFGNGQKASKLVDIVRGETAELFFDDPLPQE